MKTFFESLREHAMKIINFKKKKINLLKKKTEIISKCKKILYLKAKFDDKHAKDKNHH